MGDVKQKDASLDAGLTKQLNNEQTHLESESAVTLQSDELLAISQILADEEQKDEFIRYLLEEREELMLIAASYAMQAGLADVQKIAPSVNSLSELSDDFAALVAAGVSPQAAYRATALSVQESKNPSMGSVGGIYSPQERLYSKNEIEGMSKKDIDALSDAQFAKLRKSVTKWR